jgi:NADH-quinone oxidoreductase subunit L
MVTAGVYMVARCHVLFAMAPLSLEVVAWIGAATAIFAATIAVAQTDIKRVLAYSTISQLGYMFLAVGVGAYVAAMFHMVTHAFFKALLFLGAGSAIHGLHGEQDMRRMGGLRRFMPVTAATFIAGWLAIAGVPPFAGFWSKDEILLSTWASGISGSKVLWGIGLATALLTAFYMSRQVFMVFFGQPRWAGSETAPAPASVGAAANELAEGADPEHGPADADAAHPQPHESPWLMTLPLVVLAVLSFAGGVVNLALTSDLKFLEHWLEPVLGEHELHIEVITATKLALAAMAVVVALIGIGVASLVYLQRRLRPVEPEVLARGWYVDEEVTAFVGGPGRKAFDAAAWFDAHVVDGAANGLAAVVRDIGRRLRSVQSGFVRSYALGVTIGVVVVLGYFLTRLTF